MKIITDEFQAENDEGVLYNFNRIYLSRPNLRYTQAYLFSFRANFILKDKTIHTQRFSIWDNL